MIATINTACLEERTTNSTIVFKDPKGGRSKYYVHNIGKKIIEKYKIDGILLKDEEKCDNGLWIVIDNKLFLIELKGCDLTKACSQISSTLNYFERIKLLGKYSAIEARIVLTKVNSPDLEGVAYKALRKRMHCYNGELVKKSIELHEDI